jgi:LmbE family N-acetylglucosaminyl deacetylase
MPLSKLISTPSDIFPSGTKHLFVFAHQDDDLPYAGLLQRALPDSQVIWVTNGDGLAPFEGWEPEAYAVMRTGEGRAALRILGYPPENVHFLGHSELMFYALFAELHECGTLSGVPAILKDQVTAIATEIKEAIRPAVEAADVVWTLAWQGGHPEHDLTHYLTARVVQETEIAQGRRIPFYELPAYELTVLVPLRFAPWHRGVRHRIDLSAQELRLKEAAFSAYKSQGKITSQFKNLIRIYGALSALRLRPFGFKGYARVEEFAPVPANRDYLQSTHGHDFLDYMFDDYQGRPVTFSGSIRRFVELLK